MPPLITSRTESLGQPHHEPLSDASARSRGLAGAPGKVVLLTTAEEAQSRGLDLTFDPGNAEAVVFWRDGGAKEVGCRAVGEAEVVVM